MNTRPEASWEYLLLLLLSQPCVEFSRGSINSEGGCDTQLGFEMRREENGSHTGSEAFTETAGLSQEGLAACCPFFPVGLRYGGSSAVPCVVWCQCPIE